MAARGFATQRVAPDDPANRSIRATFANGSAGLTIGTFSGNVEIAKR
jgi:hypothetical protein